MPRGNDGDAAGTELKARTGEAPNAEEMIAANAERWGPELRAANNRPIDQAATDELDEEEVAGLIEGDDEVLGWAVRGPFVVVVSENPDTGEVTKQAVARKGQEKKAERLAGPAAEDPEEADARAQKEAQEAEKEHEKAEAEAAKADEKAEKEETHAARRTARA